MVRSLDALSSISEDTLKSAPDDHLLRGISAEAGPCKMLKFSSWLSAKCNFKMCPFKMLTTDFSCLLTVAFKFSERSIF